MAKCYFPHKFNTPENQDYIGQIPDLHFYTPELMTPAKNQAFEIWYLQQSEVEFNFKEEILKYCHSDVDIYKKQSLHSANNLNP